MRREACLTVVYVKTISDRFQHFRLRVHREWAIMKQSFRQVLIDACDADMTEEREPVVAYIVHPWYVYSNLSIATRSHEFRAYRGRKTRCC